MGAHVKRARHVGTALFAAVWSLAVATPAMAQDHAGDPDRPLATRQVLETAAGQLEAKGDSQRAAAIRARLADGDFQPGDRVLLRVDSEPALSDTFTVTPGRTLALPAPVNRDVPCAACCAPSSNPTSRSSSLFISRIPPCGRARSCACPSKG